MLLHPVRHATTTWALAAVLGLSWAAPAVAKPAAKERVVVQPFSGPSSARVRESVVGALKASKRYELVPNERARETAGELGVDLSSDAGRAAVASQLGVAGFVSGTVAKRGRQLELTLQVYGGASGTLTEEKKYRARKPALLVRQVRKRLQTELRRTPLPLEPPEPAEPEPEPEPEPEVSEAEPEPEPVAAPQPDAVEREARPEDEAEDEDAAEGAADEAFPALELALGARFMTRSYSYDQPVTRLPEHSVALTPAALVHLRWYPGAHFTQGFASHLGLEAYGELMANVEATVGPAVHTTEHSAFGLNLRARIPFAPSELGVHVGWGAYNVDISDSQFGGDPEVPGVAYRFVRIGADGRLVLATRFALKLSASYLVLLDFGELAEMTWFPDASGGGVQAQLGASYLLVGPLWVEADLGITHFFLSMNVDATPAAAATQRVAEGASDQQLFAALALELRL